MFFFSFFNNHSIGYTTNFIDTYVDLPRFDGLYYSVMEPPANTKGRGYVGAAVDRISFIQRSRQVSIQNLGIRGKQGR